MDLMWYIFNTHCRSCRFRHITQRVAGCLGNSYQKNSSTTQIIIYSTSEVACWLCIDTKYHFLLNLGYQINYLYFRTVTHKVGIKKNIKYKFWFLLFCFCYVIDNLQAYKVFIYGLLTFKYTLKVKLSKLERKL